MLDYEFLFIISIPVYIIFIIHWIYRKNAVNKIITKTIFYFYVISVIAVTLFPIPFQGLEEIGKYGGGNNNFIPFHSIIDILGNINLPFSVKIKQIAGNLILLLPLGFFIPGVWEKKYTLTNILWIGIIFSLGIEITQFIISSLLGFNYKNFDVDDIILNSLGTMIGYICYLFSFSKEK